MFGDRGVVFLIFQIRDKDVIFLWGFFRQLLRPTMHPNLISLQMAYFNVVSNILMVRLGGLVTFFPLC